MTTLAHEQSPQFPASQFERRGFTGLGVHLSADLGEDMVETKVGTFHSLLHDIQDVARNDHVFPRIQSSTFSLTQISRLCGATAKGSSNFEQFDGRFAGGEVIRVDFAQGVVDHFEVERDFAIVVDFGIIVFGRSTSASTRMPDLQQRLTGQLQQHSPSRSSFSSNIIHGRADRHTEGDYRAYCLHPSGGVLAQRVQQPGEKQRGLEIHSVNAFCSLATPSISTRHVVIN